MTDQGFIILHRKLMNSQVWLNDGLLKLFLWCLLKANHKDKWVPVNTGRGSSEVKIKRGQFLFGSKTAAKELKMKPGTVYSRMQKLQNMQNISMQSSSHYSVVTVCNYDSYQNQKNGVQQANQQPISNQSATNQQPINTTNNDNNDNKDNNNRISAPAAENSAKNKTQHDPEFDQYNDPVFFEVLEVWMKKSNLTEAGISQTNRARIYDSYKVHGPDVLKRKFAKAAGKNPVFILTQIDKEAANASEQRTNNRTTATNSHKQDENYQPPWRKAKIQPAKEG